MAILNGDILLNDDGKIFSVNGDLASGDNKEQAIGAIVNADSGNFRKWPTLAANLSKELAGPLNSRDIAAKIQNAASLDGWRVDSLKIDIDTLEEKEITIVEAVKVSDNTKSLV